MICAFLQHPLIIKNDQYQKYDGETKSFTDFIHDMSCSSSHFHFTKHLSSLQNMLVHELNISPKY